VPAIANPSGLGNNLWAFLIVLAFGCYGDEIRTILLVIVRATPKGCKTLLPVQEMLSAALGRLGSANSFPARKWFCIADLQNQRSARRKASEYGLKETDYLSMSPCLESLEPGKADLAGSNPVEPLWKVAIPGFHKTSSKEC
jgi:hypothetical protein